ncbi:excisionase family DNA-binding protein [Aporhodopirellula aestuarii]|uniref:Helix-turn-helix domain-containing protein n=1 Tax=Aporhodopirellula aestuarii TaxID=2950107 RepID=A0ABT0UA99_9BACT|nr:excisionase family DNA-binding protein [Aporhodopirellula aestuarii]MCM2373924.1 helix-turn-helix domain-containing protein [Aporhodopirellula aestuarii]
MSQMSSGAMPPPRYVIAPAPRKPPVSVPRVEESPPPSEPSSEKLAYSLQGAAERLDVSLSTLRRAIDAGEIRSTKLGRRRIIPAQALEDFLAPKPN